MVLYCGYKYLLAPQDKAQLRVDYSDFHLSLFPAFFNVFSPKYKFSMLFKSFIVYRQSVFTQSFLKKPMLIFFFYQTLFFKNILGSHKIQWKVTEVCPKLFLLHVHTSPIINIPHQNSALCYNDEFASIQHYKHTLFFNN